MDKKLDIKPAGLAESKFSKQELNYLYNVGVNNFKTKNYQRALSMFQLLLMLDANNPLYMKAAAGAYHITKNYLSAILAYRYCYALDPSPMNHDCKFYIGVCYFETNNWEIAKTEFEDFLKQADKNMPELNKKAQLYLLAIDKKITLAANQKNQVDLVMNG
ncbi:MAG: Anaphase-promoting complex, cyclosome, subunit 3 [Pseudomonadota bacterium]|nr:Anaphase-promoting complex, cyclosome, subunit 3 [Pseudomonadota bacterium]